MASKIEGALDASPAAIEDLGWALGTLLRSYLRRVGDEVAELPGGPRGYHVLSVVASGACQNQAAIAEQLGIDRTVMTYLLDDLEAQGLVVRQPDPVDRRSRQVRLTPQGVARLAVLTERVSHVERHLLVGLTAAEADNLRSMLLHAAHVEANGAPESTCEIVGSLDVPA